MPKFTRSTARSIAERIVANCNAYHYGHVTHEQFHAASVALWREADRGELCVIGSPCAKRCSMVSAELRTI